VQILPIAFESFEVPREPNRGFFEDVEG